MYPPAVLPSAPPVRFGRRVDENGARPVEALIAEATRDFGKVERSYLTPGFTPADEVVKRRTVEAKPERVDPENQRLLWRANAAGCKGCLGAMRA